MIPTTKSEISFEFFPPRTTDGATKLQATWRDLGELKPRFFSVTFGAGGSTREGTKRTVMAIKEDNYEVAPHLSCIGCIQSDINTLLDDYKVKGVRRLVVLRGDMPSGMGTRNIGDFNYASELIAHIRSYSGDWFHIECACYPEVHPQSNSAHQDLLNFQRKVQSGADSAITQYFYNADGYFRFVEKCQKLRIDIPIIPGIMPISNFTQLRRFSESCGAEIPRWMVKELESLEDDQSAIRECGLDIVTRLCEQLLKGGAPGLHFYTLNHAGLSREIVGRLGLSAD